MADCTAVHEESSAAYQRLVRCDRKAGHEGQHEAFHYDLAWGPPEPGWTGSPHERAMLGLPPRLGVGQA